MRRPHLLPVLVALALLLAACGGDGSGGDTEEGASGSASGWGEPADEASADRTIEVELTDFKFVPDTLEIEAGETITFVARNTGEASHELTIGDFAFHQEHAEAAAGGHQHDATGTTGPIDPGQEASFTWAFPEDASELIYGCHVDGHFGMGMRGRIQVR